MKVWHKENYGVPMWGPSKASKNLLASGSNLVSQEGAPQQNFLRINQMTNEGVKMVGCSVSPAAFTSLHWEDNIDEYGVIAGGMADGFITLWSPK